MAKSERGWAYFNDGSGIEWSRNHPVRSGEVPDATEILAMTKAQFEKRYPITETSNDQ